MVIIFVKWGWPPLWPDYFLRWYDMIFDTFQLAYLNTIDNMNMLLRQCLHDALSYFFQRSVCPSSCCFGLISLYHIVVVCCFDFCIPKQVPQYTMWIPLIWYDIEYSPFRALASFVFGIWYYNTESNYEYPLYTHYKQIVCYAPSASNSFGICQLWEVSLTAHTFVSSNHS